MARRYLLQLVSVMWAVVAKDACYSWPWVLWSRYVASSIFSFPFQMMLKIYWMPYYNITLVRAWLPNHRVEEKRYQPGIHAFNCRVRKTFCTKYCTFWSSLFCTVAKLSLIEFHMWMWSRSTKRQYKYKLFKMVL